MTGGNLLVLALVCLVTSCISVVTGSTSAITVPVMFQFGVDPRVAVATNMFALIFMSIGGTLPFLKSNVIDRSRLPALVLLTLFGSGVGAYLLLVVPKQIIPTFVSACIIGLAIFSTYYRRAGADGATLWPTRTLANAGYALTFLLGIYGGLFSGGYVTILTAIFVATFRMTFTQAIATTKLINVFSSAIATAIFMWRGLIDYRLGVALGATMFVGALIGAHWAGRVGELWLRRVYLAAVYALGLKALLFDLPRDQHSPLKP
jgi:uncharacterized membrane protein YfcA